jgi:ABC-2 type transport system permease protein
MKPVIEIAKTELKRLFYSPVAWLVMIVFGYQVFNTFSGTVNAFLSVGEFKGFSFTTFSFFSSMPFVGEFFIRVQGAFYLYIPLLTMNILSRDFSSGSIKLLFSSPLSTRQIITGKYLSLLTFIFLMTCVVAIPSFYMAMQIENVEWLLIFNGLLGMFLLASCYAAIGLYISSLTHYPLIAVISTFAVLFLLNSIGQFWQDIPFVRDLTYWFSVSGRSTVFIQGMISTESVIYFFAVIGFFLIITIIRMNGFRGKRSNGRLGKQYLSAILITAVIGYISSLPAMIHYWDLTRSDLNTISRESQKIMEKLHGGLTITSYTNMLDMETNYLALPSAYKANVARFDNYVRFKPATRVDFKYYSHFVPNDLFTDKFPGMSPEHILDSLKEINDWNFDIQPYDEIKKEADLSSEDFRFVTKIETSNGKKTFLRVYDDNTIYPNEMQISAALKRLTEDLPSIGFTAGHGERNIDRKDDKNYGFLVSQKNFRYSLVNNGFDVEAISLAKPDTGDCRCEATFHRC